MSNLHEHYNLLTSLTMLHLMQEHAKGEWITSDNETCEFFRKRLQPQTAVPKAVPKAPPVAPPPPKPTVTMPPKAAAPMPAPAPPPIQPQQPSIIEEAPKVTASTEKPFALTPHTPKARDGMDDWKRILTDVAPKLDLLNTPLSPEEVYRLKTSGSITAKVWVVISKQMSPAHINLLTDLSRAITIDHAEACLIDYEQFKIAQGSPTLVIVSTSHQHVVQDREHVVVPELDALMENPDQKAMLWADISKRM